MYTDDLAEKLKERVGQKWRPSNGTEGRIFVQAWCDKCKNGANRDCPILAATIEFYYTDERYPKEWQYGYDGQPKCTAFEA